MKILILKPSSLGDVIHALPVLRLLKKHLPASEIFWWLDSALVPLLQDDPDLTGIVPFNRRGWMRPPAWPRFADSVRALRQYHFNWAIDLQGLARSSLFAWWSNPELIIGLDNPREGGREGARALYDVSPPPAPPQTHAVDRYLAVLPLLQIPVNSNFIWMPPRPIVAARVRERWAADSTTWITLLPGARWENKRWPVEYFIQLVSALSGPTPVKFVILGSASEQALGEKITAAHPQRCLNLAGQTSLPEMIEWIRLSRLTVTNDTGPMHVAAALGRPVVALFGPTHPPSTGPYGQLQNVLQDTSLPCVPCLKRKCFYPEPLACLHHISPAAVAAKVRALLDAPVQTSLSSGGN